MNKQDFHVKEPANQFSITLTFKDKQNYFFTLQSLCNLTQSAIILNIEKPELIEHTQWDVYNAIELIKMLINDDGFE